VWAFAKFQGLPLAPRSQFMHQADSGRDAKVYFLKPYCKIVIHHVQGVEIYINIENEMHIMVQKTHQRSR
jgi:hypothetical protein